VYKTHTENMKNENILSTYFDCYGFEGIIRNEKEQEVLKLKKEINQIDKKIKILEVIKRQIQFVIK